MVQNSEARLLHDGAEQPRQYGTDNWIEIHTWNPWRRRFMFADTEDYLADHIFTQRKIRVRFYRGEYQKEDSPYRWIFCSVKAADGDAFIESMADLHRAILIAGYRDYDDACEFARLANKALEICSETNQRGHFLEIFEKLYASPSDRAV